jgi:hypothetical protein
MRLAMAEMTRTFSEPSLHAVVVVWCDLCSKRRSCHRLVHRSAWCEVSSSSNHGFRASDRYHCGLGSA